MVFSASTRPSQQTSDPQTVILDCSRLDASIPHLTWSWWIASCYQTKGNRVVFNNSRRELACSFSALLPKYPVDLLPLINHLSHPYPHQIEPPSNKVFESANISIHAMGVAFDHTPPTYDQATSMHSNFEHLSRCTPTDVH